jgi:hypothetical protein
MGNIVNLSSPE